jgi:hypothetical protein
MTQTDIVLSYIRDDLTLFPSTVQVDNDSIYFSDDLHYDMTASLSAEDLISDELKNILDLSITEQEIISILLKYNEFISEYNDRSLYIANRLLNYFQKMNIIKSVDFTDDFKVLLASCILRFIKAFSKYFVLFIMTLNKDEIETISKSISARDLKIDSTLFRNIKSYANNNEHYVKLLVFLTVADDYNIIETLRSIFEKNPLLSNELISTISVAAEKLAYYYIVDETSLRLLQEMLAKNYIDKINLSKLCFTYAVPEIRDNLIDVVVHS